MEVDVKTIADSFGALGPALGAVVVIGIVCYFLIKLLVRVLDMFEKHGQALKSIEGNMNAHTNVINDLSRNIQANTKSTEKMIDIISTKFKK